MMGDSTDCSPYLCEAAHVSLVLDYYGALPRTVSVQALTQRLPIFRSIRDGGESFTRAVHYALLLFPKTRRQGLDDAAWDVVCAPARRLLVALARIDCEKLNATFNAVIPESDEPLALLQTKVWKEAAEEAIEDVSSSSLRVAVRMYGLAKNQPLHMVRAAIRLMKHQVDQQPQQ